MDIVSFKKGFDPLLRKQMDVFAKRASDQVPDVFLRRLIHHPETIALSGGKRLRPYLAFLGYRSAGGKSAATVKRICIALELFHAFALVHDDIIDRGDQRHGKETTHRFAARVLQKAQRRGDLDRAAESQAILAGDLLLSWSFESLQNGLKNEAGGIANAVRRIYHEMTEEVILGQMIDVDLTTRRRVDSHLIDQKMRMKTAGYSFVRPLMLGLALAGANKAFAAFAKDFGEPLGVAFQIQDDLLDLTSSPAALKKNALADLAENQHTLFTQYIFERGNTAQQKALGRLMGSTLTKNDRKRAQLLFKESGALEHGRLLVTAYLDQCEEALSNAPFSGKRARSFYELVELIRSRKA